MIPTAEEILIKESILLKTIEESGNFPLNLTRDTHIGTAKDIKKAMIEFAKLHVEAALEEAAIKAKILEKSNWGRWEDSENEKGDLEEKVSVKINHYGHGDCSYQILTVSHESILKAYPLTNIK